MQPYFCMKRYGRRRDMKSRIITISREFGSGGRTIGKKTAEALGIACYDQELISKFAEESGFTEDYVKECGEDSKNMGWFMNAFAGRVSGSVSPQEHLWLAQRKVILELAKKESCVIVGRCADYVLRERSDVLKAFIHAAPEKRAARIVTVYGETAEAPEKRIRDKDKRRAAYYEFYTDMKWGQAEHYHIALDAGVLGIDACVNILCGLYRMGEKA